MCVVLDAAKKSLDESPIMSLVDALLRLLRKRALRHETLPPEGQ